MAAMAMSKKAAETLLRRRIGIPTISNSGFASFYQQDPGAALPTMAPASSAVAELPQASAFSGGFGVKTTSENDFLFDNPVLTGLSSAGVDDPFFNRKAPSSATTPFALGMTQFWEPPQPMSCDPPANKPFGVELLSQQLADAATPPPSPARQAMLSDFDSVFDKKMKGAAGHSATAAAVQKLAPDQVKTLTSAGIRLQGRSAEELMHKAAHVRQRRRESAARSRHKKTQHYHDLQSSNEQLRVENENLRHLLRNLQTAYYNTPSASGPSIVSGSFQ